MPTPIVLDCDPGHDDAIALLLALASPEVELVGVTTVAGNQTLEKTTANALRVLELVGPGRRAGRRGRRPAARARARRRRARARRDRPGRARPADPRGRAGRASTRSTSSPREIRARDGRLTLVPTGPLTNVALLLALHPDARPERIVLMGGAVGEGNRTPAAEFNIWADPEAARRVFASGIDVTMIGLDVTHQALIVAERRRASCAPPAASGAFVAELVDFYARFHRRIYPELGGSPMHDPVAVAHVHPARARRRPARRTSRSTARGARAAAGRTSTGAAATTAGSRTPTSALGIDADAFRALLLERIAVARLSHGRSGAPAAAKRPGMAQTKRHRKRSGASEDAGARQEAAAEAARAARGHHHPELVGLALVAVGVFLACVLWFGLNGGPVAGRGHATAIGWAAYLAPVVLVPVGALIVTRSELVVRAAVPLGLVDRARRPDAHARLGARRLRRRRARRRSSRSALGTVGRDDPRRRCSRRRRALPHRRLARRDPPPLRPRRPARLDAACAASARAAAPAASRPPPPAAGRRRASRAAGRRRAGLPRPRRRETQPAPLVALVARRRATTRRDEDTQHVALRRRGRARRADYRLPDRALLRKSKPGDGPERRRGRSASPRCSCSASRTSASRRPSSARSPGPRVTRYELQLAPGTKVAKVAQLKDDLSYALATTEIRILAPIPGKQAVGVEVPNLSPNIVMLGDIYDDLPADGEPASRSGSARTSPAPRSGPTSRGCRTC